MALEVVSSTLIIHPIKVDPLAQSVEHLTFNQGVPRSSRGWITNGEVSEWFKELVLKTSDSERGRGFESHPLRQMPR